MLRAAKVRGYCRASGEELQTETSKLMRQAGQTRRRLARRLWSMAESKPLSWQFMATRPMDPARTPYRHPTCHERFLFLQPVLSQAVSFAC
jgi:hypothetical protein